MAKQVYSGSCFWRKFLNERFTRINVMGKKILEIGGGRVDCVSNSVITLDIDLNKKPHVCANAFKLPFKDKTFDLIVCHEMACAFKPEEKARLFKEFERVGKTVYIRELGWCFWKLIGWCGNFSEEKTVKNSIVQH